MTQISHKSTSLTSLACFGAIQPTGYRNPATGSQPGDLAVKYPTHHLTPPLLARFHKRLTKTDPSSAEVMPFYECRNGGLVADTKHTCPNTRLIPFE